MSRLDARDRLIGLAALAYLLAQLVILVRLAPGDLWWWLFAVLFLVWCVSPIVGGLWLARWIKRRIAFGACFVALAAIAAIGFAEEWYVLFVGPLDAQNGLIMLFVPAYQWVAVGIALTLAWAMGRYVFKS